MLDQRFEFVSLASQSGSNITELANHFGISRKTAYKWLNRYRIEGRKGLKNLSRRPQHTRNPTPDAMVSAVKKLRKKHSAWGGRKLRRVLENRRASGKLNGVNGLEIPSASTITRILVRNNLVSEEASQAHTAPKRFERELSNELWQMDFKGDVLLSNQCTSYPLTILDDCTRFNLCLQSCDNQRFETVDTQLRSVFRRYGLPLAILTDNGIPWAHSHGALTRLELWWLRLGIQVIHGRIRHPQTQGKEERFHRTLKAEVLSGRIFPNTATLQRSFDQWRQIYNHVRPHEALNLDTPGQHYRVSNRVFPEELPAVEYNEGELTRTVRRNGYIGFKNRSWYISETLRGESVALRPTDIDGIYDVCYGAFAIGVLDYRKAQDEDPQYRRMQRYRSARQIGSSGFPFDDDEIVT